MSMLLSAIWPVLLLLLMFVVGVHLVVYIIARFVEQK